MSEKQEYEEKQEGFEEAVRPLIEWMNKNCHPHTVIKVDHTNAQIYESCHTFNTNEYLVD